MNRRNLWVAGLAILTAVSLQAAVSAYVRIVPRTYNYNVSPAIQFRTSPLKGFFIIFR